MFRVNHQAASLIDAGEPPVYARYIQHLRRILLATINRAPKSRRRRDGERAGGNVAISTGGGWNGEAWGAV